MTTSLSEINARLAELREEHRDLDEAIGQMSDNRATDQLQLIRMKKRKLRLRDQIAYWESKLIPDLDA
ncbi:YdcH family protein [Wenzhouxiangella sp. AB-CW3]|uniref:YdcH family protein n=1 Tax=Wenzhouxiangella sp. AB-CW3 TaxID=2771012 RepID=UPI00168B2CE2|nr:YdcH family protein [Wenzhouxiangella sp. AB-CW3]QOC22687.1 YdcH family protein [Wenzhouxiangella sp. AB-CW3]